MFSQRGEHNADTTKLLNAAQQQLRWYQEQLLVFLELKEKEALARKAQATGASQAGSAGQPPATWVEGL